MKKTMEGSGIRSSAGKAGAQYQHELNASENHLEAVVDKFENKVKGIGLMNAFIITNAHGKGMGESDFPLIN